MKGLFGKGFSKLSAKQCLSTMKERFSCTNCGYVTMKVNYSDDEEKNFKLRAELMKQYPRELAPEQKLLWIAESYNSLRHSFTTIERAAVESEKENRRLKAVIARLKKTLKP